MSDRTRAAEDIGAESLRRDPHAPQLPANTDALETQESQEAYDLLPDLTKEEWRRVHLVTRQGNLIQGADYFDLRNPARGEFVAQEPISIRPDDMYVAKHEVDGEIWDKLLRK